MKNLLRFELRNTLRQKGIYIAAALMLVVLTLQNRTSPERLAYYEMIGYGVEEMVIGALSSCFFTSFLAVMISVAVCRDYEQNVLKNVYAKGYPSEKVFSAKYLFALILATVLYCLTILVGYGEALAVFHRRPAEIGTILLAQYAAVLAYTSFDVLFCRLFKKGGLAIAFLILVPPIGELLLDLLDNTSKLSFSFGDLWITKTMSYIHGGNVTGKDLFASFMTSAVYLCAAYIAGRIVSRREK